MNKMQMEYLKTISGEKIINIQEGILKRKGQNATIPKITDYKHKSYDFSHYPEISEKSLFIPKNYYSNNFFQDCSNTNSTDSEFDEVCFKFVGETNGYIKYNLSISNFRLVENEERSKLVDYDTVIKQKERATVQFYLNSSFESSKDLYVNCVFFSNIRFSIIRIYEIIGNISEIEDNIYFGLDTIQSGITSMITEKYHNMFNKIYDSRFHDYVRDKNYETTMQSNTINRIYFGENIIEYLEWEKRYKDLNEN